MYYQAINFLNTKNNLILLLIIILLFQKNLLKGNVTTNIISSVIVIGWCVYVNMFLEVSKLTFGYLSNINTLNTNLLNGIMLIHPIILYILYGIYILEYKVNTKQKIKNKKKHIKYENFYKIFFCVFLIILAILLGGWWAEQELSWGGWWSWDFVELLSINYLLYLLIIIHNKPTQSYITYNLQIVLFLVAVFSVRYNIINSIHNFVSIESQNQYYYYIIFVLCFSIIFIFIDLLLKKKLFSKYTQKNFFLMILFIFFICFFINVKYVFTWLGLQINLLKNIKIVIFYTIFIYSVFWSAKRDIRLFFILFFIITTKNVFTLLDVWLLGVVLYNLKKSKNIFSGDNKINLVHSLLVVLLLITTHQIYNFIPTYKSIIWSNILNGCVNNFKLNNLFGYFVNLDKKTNGDITLGELKSIFEKTIEYTSNGVFLEIYNYNYQTLYQLYGGGVFFILCFFFVVIFFISVCIPKYSKKSQPKI